MTLKGVFCYWKLLIPGGALAKSFVLVVIVTKILII